jgi:predicted nucleic acid-binding protein
VVLPEIAVVHVSALVELLIGTDNGSWVHRRLRGTRPHAPAHIDAEVLACLDRLVATAGLSAGVADDAAERLAAMPLVRRPLDDLVLPAWTGRATRGPSDALYVALADRLRAPLVTTDARLAAASTNVEVVGREQIRRTLRCDG